MAHRQYQRPRPEGPLARHRWKLICYCAFRQEWKHLGGYFSKKTLAEKYAKQLRRQYGEVVMRRTICLKPVGRCTEGDDYIVERIG